MHIAHLNSYYTRIKTFNNHIYDHNIRWTNNIKVLIKDFKIYWKGGSNWNWKTYSIVLLLPWMYNWIRGTNYFIGRNYWLLRIRYKCFLALLYKEKANIEIPKLLKSSLSLTLTRRSRLGFRLKLTVAYGWSVKRRRGEPWPSSRDRRH